MLKFSLSGASRPQIPMGKGVEMGRKINFLKFRYKKFAFFVCTSGFVWCGWLELFGLLFGRKKKVSFGSEQADRPVVATGWHLFVFNCE